METTNKTEVFEELAPEFWKQFKKESEAVAAYRGEFGANAYMEHRVACDAESYIKWHNYFTQKEESDDTSKV